VANVLHVDADLMRSARFELAFHQRNGANALQDSVMGHRMLSLTAVLKHLLHSSVAQGASDVTFHGAVFKHVAPNQRPVTSVDGPLKKLLAEVRQRPLRLAKHHQSGGVLVEAVNQTGTGLRLVGQARNVLEVMQDTVHQRPGVIPVAGMDHEVHGLVEDQHVVVFVDHVQVHRLWEQFKLEDWLRKLHRDHVPRLHLVVALDRRAVDTHVTFFRGCLQLVAREVSDEVDDELVDAQGRLAWVRDEAVVLKQLLPLVLFVQRFVIHGRAIQRCVHVCPSSSVPTSR